MMSGMYKIARRRIFLHRFALVPINDSIILYYGRLVFSILLFDLRLDIAVVFTSLSIYFFKTSGALILGY